MSQRIAFVGAGSMAEAIFSGMIAQQFVESNQIAVTNRENKERLLELKQKYAINSSSDKKETIEGANIVVLSMKPKDAKEALDEVKGYIKEDQLVISVLAGVSTSFIEESINKKVAVVRAMPNTSATIGFSATAIAAGTYAKEAEVEKANQLFQTIGTTTIVNEEDLHAITGLSGSGPAYIYYLVEAMEQAALDEGIASDTAKELIIQTLMGAAEMLKQTQEQPGVLRKKITSPGGTTQAGLETLDQYHYQEALQACVKRATERSKELGRLFEQTPTK
ncbi:pyrroline-5-carboxylate reductase [Radiobacillus kanasensis]|uniref:pyrroline-5-carboxylate reductase n=1 Tax=Radiobacillus kanasensis TaxID=2844358 RepID=UPI001E3C2731|nr:pyrroline-5-carboxylate reductase [Radiobacillus kanasensis]UFT99444.1 pyrroline-5-carboxylate reductase [Radiobacillus kanasensis]